MQTIERVRAAMQEIRRPEQVRSAARQIGERLVSNRPRKIKELGGTVLRPLFPIEEVPPQYDTEALDETQKAA
jgi:hypothetical protein